MAMPNSQTRDEILILTADGFDETSAVYCLAQMREAGLPVSMVGISSGTVTSFHGIGMRPDRSLDQVISNGRAPRLVVIPGGRRSRLALQVDPRVSRLLQKVVGDGGYLAVMRHDEEDEGYRDLAGSDRLLNQGEMSLESFTRQLIDLTVCV